jgi:hypothetical protein
MTQRLHREGLLLADLPVGGGAIGAGAVLERQERAHCAQRGSGATDQRSAGEARAVSAGEHVFAQ